MSQRSFDALLKKNIVKKLCSHAYLSTESMTKTGKTKRLEKSIKSKYKTL